MVLAFSPLSLRAAPDGPWQPRPHEFSFEQLPLIYEYEDMLVTVHEPEDASVRAQGGTAGIILEIEVEDRRSGRINGFQAMGFWAAILEPTGFYPEFEVWSRGAPDRYHRCVYQWIKDQYCCLHRDDFVAIEAGAARRTNLQVPTQPTIVRFAGSRASYCEKPETVGAE